MADVRLLLHEAIGAYGDSSGDLDLRVGIGTPGVRIEVRNEVLDTGQALTKPGVLDGIFHAVSTLVRSGESTGTEAPTTGTHETGDFRWNVGGGATIGWFCEQGGTPGTWTALYVARGTPSSGLILGWDAITGGPAWIPVDAPTQDHAWMYLSASSGGQSVSGSTPEKVEGTTTLGLAQNFTMPANNKLQYDGAEETPFKVSVAGSMSSDTAVGVYFHLYQDGAAVPGATIDAYIDAIGGHRNLAMPVCVSLAPGGYLEVWCESTLAASLDVGRLLVSVETL